MTTTAVVVVGISWLVGSRGQGSIPRCNCVKESFVLVTTTMIVVVGISWLVGLSGQGLIHGCDSMKTVFQYSGQHLCSRLVTACLTFVCRARTKTLSLRTLKTPCPPCDKSRPVSWKHTGTTCIHTSSRIIKKTIVTTPDGRRIVTSLS